MTLKEIAQQLGVPESSLRKYREIFSGFIPSVGSGRSRRYRTDAIEILNEIRQQREEMHMPWDAITDYLAKKYPMDATPADGADDVAEQQQFFPPAAAEPTQVRVHEHPAPQPQQSVAPADNQALRKIIAVSEKQAMIVNALALEMMRSVDRIRTETRSEIAKLEKKTSDVFNQLYHSLGAYSQHERALLRDIQNRVQAIESSLSSFAAAGDQAVKVVQMKEQLRIVEEKLLLREKAINDYKKNFDVLKKENTELREFKQRHIDSAEERIREVKAQRQSGGVKRFLKFRS